MTIAKAQSKIRSVRGASFLTHGGDNYDHKGMKKARRALDRAIIEEAFDDKVVADVDMRWVVEAWRNDGDKWYLDSFDVVFISHDYETANNRCIAEDATTFETTDGRPAPMSRLTYRDVTNDFDCQCFLDYEARFNPVK